MHIEPRNYFFINSVLANNELIKMVEKHRGSLIAKMIFNGHKSIHNYVNPKTREYHCHQHYLSATPSLEEVSLSFGYIIKDIDEVIINLDKIETFDIGKATQEDISFAMTQMEAEQYFYILSLPQVNMSIIEAKSELKSFMTDKKFRDTVEHSPLKLSTLEEICDKLKNDY